MFLIQDVVIGTPKVIHLFNWMKITAKQLALNPEALQNYTNTEDKLTLRTNNSTVLFTSLFFFFFTQQVKCTQLISLFYTYKYPLSSKLSPNIPFSGHPKKSTPHPNALTDP